MTSQDAALALAAAGFYVGPLKPRDKNPGGLLAKGWPDKTTRDAATIRSWYAGHPDRGVFIHTGKSGLVVFDLDATDDLADLPEVIRTALSTGGFQRSRSGARGHYLFTSGERLGNASGAWAAFGDVRSGNGVIVVGPSVHPTTGRPYEWVRTGPVPPLPAALRNLVSSATSSIASEPAMTSDELQAFIDAHQTGTAVERMQGPIHEFTRRVKEGESRHVTMASIATWAMREVRAGIYPAEAVIAGLRSAYEQSFAVGAADARERPGAGEFNNLVEWAAAQPGPQELARGIWDMSPTLGMVRRIAQERMVAPFGLLGAGLLQALVAVPPKYVLPATFGSSAATNLFLGMVGPPGAGKGITEDVATEWFVLPYAVAQDLYRGKPGSGEGIPKLFGQWQKAPAPAKGTEWVYTHTRAYMSLPEVDNFKALLGRDSSTLSSVLREAWTGAKLGNDYATVERRVFVRARRYRLVMSIGIQPERAQPIFQDAAGGLPQRFIFASMLDKDLADPTGDEGDLTPIVLPTWDDEDVDAWRSVMGDDATTADVVPLRIPPEVATALIDARRRTLRGEQVGLEGHRLLLMEKVALGFAVLHGRTDGFDLEHWRMAELFMVHSDATRDEVQSAMASSSRAARDARARSEGVAEVEKDDAKHAALVKRARERVLKLLDEEDADKWVGAATIKQHVSRDQREILDGVLRDLTRERQIVRRRATSGSTEGSQYRRATS